VEASPQDTSGRERVLATAYGLFSRHGTRAVGVDRIIAESGVAKMTLYRNFASKDDLILAFLERREELWTRAWLQAEVERRASTPAARLLAIFDVFGDWFALDGFEGCSFINVMLEIDDPGHPVRDAAVRSPSMSRALSGRPGCATRACCSAENETGEGGGVRCVTTRRAVAAAGGRGTVRVAPGSTLSRRGATAAVATTGTDATARGGTATATRDISLPAANASRGTAVTAPGMARFA